jgi:TetR/AcrR family transcriptional repressor of mexJK operon
VNDLTPVSEFPAGARPAEPHPSSVGEPSPKRVQMLEAATTLFIAQGYGPVSMDAVARAAGVSKATLYTHFASKDALFATIIGEACRRNTGAGDSFPTNVDDIGAALRMIGGRVLRFLLEDSTQAIYRVVVSESTRFPELGRAFMANGPQVFCDRFSAWVAEQTQAGLLAAADPQLAAQQFMALLKSGLFMRASLAITPPASEAEIDATVAAAVRTFLAAFG